jgi:hypothetical protein
MTFATPKQIIKIRRRFKYPSLHPQIVMIANSFNTLKSCLYILQACCINTGCTVGLIGIVQMLLEPAVA